MELNKIQIFDRVAEALDKSKVVDIANLLGLTPGAVSQWKVKGNISLESLFSVSLLSDVSIHWLVTGEGAKYWKQLSTPLVLVSGSADTPSAPIAFPIIPATGSIDLPFAGSIEANQQHLTIFEENRTMQAPAILASKSSVVIAIEGDGWMSEGLYDRDLLIVTAPDGETHGRIVVASLPGERCLVRKFSRAGHLVALAPIVGNAPVYRFPAEDVNVLWVVTSITHQYPE